MDNIKNNINNEVKSNNKVLDTIKQNKKYKFQKIDTGNIVKTSKEKLYLHQCNGYEIEEVASQFGREPLVLSGVSHSYDKRGKEFVVYSPDNVILEIYPKLTLAKDLVKYALDKNLDFKKDSLERGIHYKLESNLEKKNKKAEENFNKTKESTETIRKTAQTGGGGNMTKSLVNKANNAHSKLNESALKLGKTKAILKIRNLSNFNDSELEDETKKLVLELGNTTDFADKFKYGDSYFDNGAFNLKNDKIKALDQYIKKYCSARDKKEISEAFKNGNNMLLKNYHLVYEL